MKFLFKLDLSNYLKFLLYLFVFLQPFNRFNAFKEIGFYGLLLLFVIKLFRGSAKDIKFNDRTIIALFCLILWSLAVSVFGPYPLDSLNAFGKKLGAEVLIFFVIITEFKNIRELKTLFRVVVASFGVVTFASVVENISTDLTRFDLLRKTHKMFIGGYANNATFYLPFIAAWLLIFKEASWKKWFGTIALLLGHLIVFFYNSRTPFLAVIHAHFIIFFAAKKYKLLIIYAIAVTLVFNFILSSKSPVFEKYRSLANPETFTTSEGAGKRPAVWQGALHIIEKRPVVGYGYGWKKMAWTIDDLKLREYWKEKYPQTYEYYVEEARVSYGRVNPHNLVLQIVFEVGLVGLLIFLWLWWTVMSKMFKIISLKERSVMKNFVLYSTGIIVSYGIINLTNGFWQETYGNMIFLFMASVFVIYKQHVNELKLHGEAA